MTIQKAAALNIALYIFISLNPYIRWILPNELFYIFFTFTTILITGLLNSHVRNSLNITSYRLQILFIFLIYILYFTSPLFHELRWGHMVYPLPFLFILFYNNKIIQNGYLFLKKIFIWISVFSLIVWLLSLLNVPIPYYSYDPDFRIHATDNYRIYGLAVSLYTGDLPTGGIMGFERITGVFAEPGHFGIYLGLILAIEKFNFNSRSNKILLTTGILTLSTAFYGILFMGIVFRVILERKIPKNVLYVTLIFILLISIGSLLFGDAATELILGDLIKSSDTVKTDAFDVVDSRVNDRFKEEFNYFVYSNNFYFGLGYSSDMELAVTNWRGLIFRFGLVGLIIIISLILVIAKNASLLYGFLLIGISLLILSHRSYFFYSPAIFLLLFLAVTIQKLNKVTVKI